MAGKIRNTLKYGDKRTKGKLYLMFGMLAAGVLLLFVSLLTTSLLLGIVAFLALFTDVLVLINSNFSKKEITMQRVPEKKKSDAVEHEYGALEWMPTEKREKKVEKEADENPLLSYDTKKMKKIMVAYKVKREHVPVMIDYCPAERISQCPAYVWKDMQYLYFLLLEEEPRMIKTRLEEADAIHIRRGVPARPSQEYSNMKEKSLVSKLFSEYLPNYYQANQEGLRTEYRKNLYSAAPGVWCTAASVKNLLKLLPERFLLDDGRMAGESEYYQEVSVSRILYWDGVYTAEEYKQKVTKTLAMLADADVSNEVFHTYLARIVLKGLIPQEYADYAISRRAKK